MHPSNKDHDETLKEQIMEIVDITHSNCPYVKPCPVYNQSIRAIQEVLLQDRERAVKELAESFHNRIFNNFSMLPRIQSTYTGNRNIDARELQKVMCDFQRDLAQLSNPTQEKKSK